MSQAESILVSMEFTTARCPHKCGHNGGHRIERGAPRLTIRDDDSEHHLCLPCAKLFLVQGAEQLRLLLAGADRLEFLHFPRPDTQRTLRSSLNDRHNY